MHCTHARLQSSIADGPIKNLLSVLCILIEILSVLTKSQSDGLVSIYMAVEGLSGFYSWRQRMIEDCFNKYI